MMTGTIAINEYTIATWQAWRADAAHGNYPDAVNLYHCKVWYKATDGFNQYGEFDIQHTYGGGALLLAAKVLKEAPRWLRRDYGNKGDDQITAEFVGSIL